MPFYCASVMELRLTVDWMVKKKLMKKADVLFVVQYLRQTFFFCSVYDASDFRYLMLAKKKHTLTGRKKGNPWYTCRINL